GVERSPSTTPSNATTTTRCRAAPWRLCFGANPAKDVFPATRRVWLISQDRTRGTELVYHPPPLLIMDYIGPAAGAVVFVLGMSLVKEPARRTFNAVFVAGASGVYLSGGLGQWELVYPAIATPVAYLGVRSYRFIGIAWLMHAAWDIVHHLYGNP